jgi:RND superfamily putative drug exporter
VTRRAWLIAAVWAVFVLLLAGQGRNVDNELRVHPLFAAGSQSQRAAEIAQREFGDGYSMIVLLRGPPAAVKRQGEALAAQLDSAPETLVLTPWTRNSLVDGLSPRPGVAGLMVRRGGSSDAVSGLLGPLRREVDNGITAPVHSSIAGVPVLVNSLQESSASAASTGELIAIPILLFVLLFVFRSLLAALTPLLIGGTVVLATRGLLALLSGVIEIDLFGLVVSAMMGLALGVDYSLLVVSRFREERARGDLPAAVEATVRATVRSIIPAGSALLLAMLAVPVFLPGVMIRSVAIGVGIATSLSMFAALFIVPALLVLYGKNLDRWSLPRRRPVSAVASLRWSRLLRDKPGVTLAFVFGLLIFSALAFNLNSDLLTAGLLAPSDPGRRQQETVEHALGTGWVSPTEILVDGRGSPITSPSRLRAIANFQRRAEADPGVASMAGLLPIEQGAKGLYGLGGQLVRQERGLRKLKTGIARVGAGAARNSSGLKAAAAGSSALEAGVSAAGSGAGALASGLRRTSAGSARLASGLDDAGEGSEKVADGASKASGGAGKLAHGLARASEETGELQGGAQLAENTMSAGETRLHEVRQPLRRAEEQLAAAREALQRMTSGRSDSEYGPALAAVEEASRQLTGRDPGSGEVADSSYRGVAHGIERAEGQFSVGTYLAKTQAKTGEQASEGIEKLAHASSRLDRGLQRLARGGDQVSEGVASLAQGGQVLSPALRRLSHGATRLSKGIGLLEEGSGKLQNGLQEGAAKSGELPVALHRIHAGLEGQGGGQEGKLTRGSPGLFHSAYFTLASLDGTRPGRKVQLNQLINVDGSGTDARLLVIPRDPQGSDAAQATTARLEAEAAKLARQTGTEVLVGGAGPATSATNREFRDQAPWIRLTLSLISLIILVPLLRSLVVPLLTVLINLITVSATFGVLSLLFNGSLLGGPGYVDSSVIPDAILVIFAIAIDYEVFILSRVREEYLRTGSTSEAVATALDRTGHVISGAAVIMITVFLAFATSEFATIRDFGVAQAFAIFIDAFIVRLVVLPALMLWLGDRCWWMPRWLSWFAVSPARSPALKG